MKLAELKYEHPYVRLYIGPFRVFKKRLTSNNLPPQNNNKAPKRILIVKTDSIGDYVLMRNFWAEIKKSKKYHNAQITLLLSSCMKGIAEYLDRPNVEAIFYLPHPFWKLNLLKQYLAIKNLFRQGLKKQYDEIWFPSFNVYSYQFLNAILCDQIKAEKTIGQVGDLDWKDSNYKNGLSLLTHCFTDYERKHSFEFEHNRAFFEHVIEEQISLPRPYITVNKTANKTDYVIVAPSAQDFSRRWHEANYAQTIRKIIEKYHLKVILIGAKAEKKFLLRVKQLCPPQNCEIQAGQKFNVLIPQLANARLFVGNDSGIFHIAAACGTPSICISAELTYQRFTQYPPCKTYQVITHPLVKDFLSCPLENRQQKFDAYPSFVAVNSISVQEVTRAVDRLLNTQNKNAKQGENK